MICVPGIRQIARCALLFSDRTLCSCIAMGEKIMLLLRYTRIRTTELSCTSRTLSSVCGFYISPAVQEGVARRHCWHWVLVCSGGAPASLHCACLSRCSCSERNIQVCAIVIYCYSTHMMVMSVVYSSYLEEDWHRLLQQFFGELMSK